MPRVTPAHRRSLCPTPCCAGCLKNVLVVWGGILQGDVVTSRELQVRQMGCLQHRCRACNWQQAIECTCFVGVCWPSGGRRLQVHPGVSHVDCMPAPLPQGYAISLAGFVLFSAARYRRPAGAGHSGDSSGRKRQ